MCCQVVLCVVSQKQIGRGHVYIEYPKSAKRTADEYTQEEVLRVKCEFIIFSGIFFLYVKHMQWSLRPVVIIMCPCSTPQHFPEGNHVLKMYYVK